MVEVRPTPSSHLLCDVTGAFVNVITWASGLDEFRAKVEMLMHGLGLFVASIEDMEPLSRRGGRQALERELSDIALEIESKPDGIMYGTFHTWTEGRA